MISRRRFLDLGISALGVPIAPLRVGSTGSAEFIDPLELPTLRVPSLGLYYERLKDPELAFSNPNLHFIHPFFKYNSIDKIRESEAFDLSDLRIAVDTRKRNVYVFLDDISYDSMLFRAPTIIGSSGRNLRGTYYTSSFSTEGTVWIPRENPGRRIIGVFGNLWVPMQSRDIAVNAYEGGWAPSGYNLYAIHGTDNNEAFKSRQRFRETRSRGCARLYKDAVPDLQKILLASAINPEQITALARNPNPYAIYILNRTIPVTFGEDIL